MSINPFYIQLKKYAGYYQINDFLNVTIVMVQKLINVYITENGYEKFSTLITVMPATRTHLLSLNER